MPTADPFQWPQGQPLFEVMWRTVSQSFPGNGIVSATDLKVTATANALEIEVATGDVLYDGTQYTVSSAEPHTLSGGDGTYDRWDTVYFDTGTGASGVREGTPAANPEPPDITGGELLLAVVYVEQNATNVAGSDILNWRAASAGGLASGIAYDDSTGAYGVSTVDGALDELEEAAQISAYPLAPGTDLNVSAYPFALADLASPYSLASLTDLDVAGNDLVDAGTTIWNTSIAAVPQAQLGGPAASLSAYPLVGGTDVVYPVLFTGNTTFLGGGGASVLRVPGVTTDETAQLNVSTYVSATNFSGIDYAYADDWWPEWDNADGELDVLIQLDWQTDPGNGNDITVNYTIKEEPK